MPIKVSLSLEHLKRIICTLPAEEIDDLLDFLTRVQQKIKDKKPLEQKEIEDDKPDSDAEGSVQQQ